MTTCNLTQYKPIRLKQNCTRPIPVVVNCLLCNNTYEDRDEFINHLQNGSCDIVISFDE
jgi:hypothetical protein